MSEMTAAGHWEGELSSSALSTATAVVALSTVESRASHGELITGGLRWLCENQNEDGGWGDTPASRSNISTTALCWAALSVPDGILLGDADVFAKLKTAIARAEQWLRPQDDLAGRITARYGKDRTFSVPILMMLAIRGRLGERGWGRIPKLPFELAAIPQQFWGAIQLPVVSYALPALIAIGQAIHHHAPTRNPVTRLLRALTREKTLRVLGTLQPPGGGFLEATPLTSFVTMALASAGRSGHEVAREGVEFLKASVRKDGSWPIDTNLATWTSTLSIKALPAGVLSARQCEVLRRWLLGQQWTRVHPYTNAAPGGWAWTNLPGGVPDADDTPGALLALLRLGAPDSATVEAGRAGVRWLLDLQNRDGGIPTFCRGWGALPFDRSSPDLTAHTLRAWVAWREHLPARKLVDGGIELAVRFLRSTQRVDGAWVPLWFGNEHAADEENPLYGTAHVVVALRELAAKGHAAAGEMAVRGARWLVAAQNEDGGWGGVQGAPSSTEETALALEALAGSEHGDVIARGAEWLIGRVENGRWREPSPIGFYFAKLWYYERLYPQIWTVSALAQLAAGARNSRLG